MRPEYNIYCDESCHLMHSDGNIMVFGAIWCPKNKRQEIFKRMREIKAEFGFKPVFEVKWHKVSPAQIEFYLHLANYFFDDNDLHYRALIVPDKRKLDHETFHQTHNEFYYKMYFDLLKVILDPLHSYNIYMDIKDTQGGTRVEKLQEVLRNNQYDFRKQIIRQVQQVHSQEVEILQLTDLLTGAIGYLHRGLTTNRAKVKIVEKMQSRSGYTLLRTTLYKEEKMNIFIWKPREQNNE